MIMAEQQDSRLSVGN